MEKSDSGSEEFYPKGAIAFFVAMIILFVLMWFSIYFEVLNRI
ncbi:MAG: hypothetical protein WD035_07185 [Balneolaceae bacterium]